MTSRPLRVLVAEDEPYNLKRLVRLLEEAGCEVVAQIEDGPAVLEWVAQGQPIDALFLDIQMPGLNGLELVAELPRPIPVVFVTAYSEHAVRAFEQAAVDYLLKPVTSARLAQTLLRLSPAPGGGPRNKSPYRYPVKAGDGLLLVDLAHTTHFTFEEGFVWSHMGERRARCLWKTLAEAEEALGTAVIRGHRHLLIRPEAVLGIRAGEFGRLRVRLQGGREIEVSRGAAPGLKERLGLA